MNDGVNGVREEDGSENRAGKQGRGWIWHNLMTG